MILAQNWPKTAKSSWHCPLKCYLIYQLFGFRPVLSVSFRSVFLDIPSCFSINTKRNFFDLSSVLKHDFSVDLLCLILNDWNKNRYRDLAGIPPRFPVLAGIPPRGPVFPAGIFPGKISVAYLCKNPAEKSVLAWILPTKKLSSGIPVRIRLPESKILVVFAARTNVSRREKKNYIGISAEELHILFRFDPESKYPLRLSCTISGLSFNSYDDSILQFPESKTSHKDKIPRVFT